MIEYVISYKTKRGAYRSLEIELDLSDCKNESDELALLMNCVFAKLKCDYEFSEIIAVEKLD